MLAGNLKIDIQYLDTIFNTAMKPYETLYPSSQIVDQNRAGENPAELEHVHQVEIHIFFQIQFF